MPRNVTATRGKSVADILGKPVAFATDTVGPMAQQTIEKLGDDGATPFVRKSALHW